jgi:hypothetical protein
MPQYMLLIYTPAEGGPPPEELEAQMPKWFEYTQALQDSGAFVSGDALQPVDSATTVRVRGGETLTTDGPFAETKEILGGYYIIDVADLDVALDWAAKMPSAPYGSTEVRPVWVFDQEEAGASQSSAQA